MPPRPRRTRPVAGLASLPDIKFTAQQVNAVVGEASKAVADKMGITVSQLPTNVQTAIKTATESAMNVRTKAVIQRDVDFAVKSTILKGAKPIDMLDARVKAAKEGIAHIAADTKVTAVLTDTANLLWKKLTALKQAGFSDTQAFDLLLAEIQGRASRNR